MTTEFKHTRAYGLTSRQFARGYRERNPRRFFPKSKLWWAVIAAGFAILVFLYVRGMTL